MSVKCSILGCKSQYFVGTHIKFFRFPETEIAKNYWLKVMPFKYNAFNEESIICSLHFKQNSQFSYNHYSDYDTFPECFHRNINRLLPIFTDDELEMPEYAYPKPSKSQRRQRMRNNTFGYRKKFGFNKTRMPGISKTDIQMKNVYKTPVNICDDNKKSLSNLGIAITLEDRSPISDIAELTIIQNLTLAMKNAINENTVPVDKLYFEYSGLISQGFYLVIPAFKEVRDWLALQDLGSYNGVKFVPRKLPTTLTIGIIIPGTNLRGDPIGILAKQNDSNLLISEWVITKRTLLLEHEELIIQLPQVIAENWTGDVALNYLDYEVHAQLRRPYRMNICRKLLRDNYFLRDMDIIHAQMKKVDYCNDVKPAAVVKPLIKVAKEESD